MPRALAVSKTCSEFASSFAVHLMDLVNMLSGLLLCVTSSLVCVCVCVCVTSSLVCVCVCVCVTSSLVCVCASVHHMLSDLLLWVTSSLRVSHDERRKSRP